MITTVLMSVLLIFIQFIINMICMLNAFVSMVLSVGFTVFVAAPVYFLMVLRVRKRGVSMIYMTIVGFVFMLMGNAYLLPYYMLIGIICEAILWKEGAVNNPARLTAAWTVFSLLANGTNLLPIWFFWDTYYGFAVESGMSPEYIDAYVKYYTTPIWIALIVIYTTLCGFLGSRVAQKLSKKHFKKAGVL